MRVRLKLLASIFTPTWDQRDVTQIHRWRLWTYLIAKPALGYITYRSKFHSIWSGSLNEGYVTVSLNLNEFIWISATVEKSYQVIFVSAFTFDISMAANCIQGEIIGEFTFWDHKTDLRGKNNDITFIYSKKWQEWLWIFWIAHRTVCCMQTSMSTSAETLSSSWPQSYSFIHFGTEGCPWLASLVS